MKSKNLKQKLSFNKSTIANLNSVDMRVALGGIDNTCNGGGCSIFQYCSDPASNYYECRASFFCTGNITGCETNDTCDTSILCTNSKCI